MHNRRMIAPAEVLTDGFQRRLGHRAAEVHRKLSRVDDFLAFLLRSDLEICDAEVFCNGRDDQLRGHFLRTIRCDVVLQKILGEREIDGLALQAGHGHDFRQCALELTDVRLDTKTVL